VDEFNPSGSINLDILHRLRNLNQFVIDQIKDVRTAVQGLQVSAREPDVYLLDFINPQNPLVSAEIELLNRQIGWLNELLVQISRELEQNQIPARFQPEQVSLIQAANYHVVQNVMNELDNLLESAIIVDGRLNALIYG